jgi:hypothetical protein
MALFMSVWKVLPFWCQVLLIHKYWTALFAYFLYQISPKSINVESMDRKSFTPLTKVELYYANF